MPRLGQISYTREMYSSTKINLVYIPTRMTPYDETIATSGMPAEVLY